MKWYFALVAGMLLLLLCSPGQAQNLDDQYVHIFNLVEEADALTNTQPAQAMAKYVEAQTMLLRLQKGSRDWNPEIVSYRLNYIAQKMAALSAKSPAPAQQPGTNATAETATAPKPPPADWESQINGLKDQVRQLQAEKGLFEAKLKEALALQTAEADPRELAKAEGKIKALQKENDLLKVTIETAKANPPIPANTKALEEAQQAFAQSQRQLAEQKDLVAKLTTERDTLQQRVKSGATTPDMAALAAENELLRKRVAELTSTPASDQPNRPSATAQAQIAALQSDKQLLQLEKQALENRVKQLSSNTVTNRAPVAVESTSDAARAKQLEKERDDLQKQLDAANKALYGKKGAKNINLRIQDLETQLASARARIELFEARQVPYSTEELALLKAPEPKFPEAEKRPAKRSIKELSPNAARMVVEARQYYQTGQFEQAESRYLQVLQQEPQNIAVLVNLAHIEVDAKHYDQAETHLKQALAMEPESPDALLVLGRLRYQQGRYDDALEALSQAAKLQPGDAEVQNYLGMTLTQKGQRGPAETAYRKAVQLQPGYARAHYNLAVAYSTQQPPAMELARWHYQKALSAGYPPNPDLEKKFAARQTK